MKQNSIGKLPDGSYRYLCKLCKDSVPGEKIFHLADLLDDDMVSIVKEKADDQVKAPISVDDRFSAVFDEISNVFAKLKSSFEQRMKLAEEKVKNRFRDFIANKEKSITNWVDINKEFQEARNNFLQSNPG